MPLYLGVCSEAVTETLRKPNTLNRPIKTNLQTVTLENLHKNKKAQLAHAIIVSVTLLTRLNFLKCFLDRVRANRASRQMVTVFLTGLIM